MIGFKLILRLYFSYIIMLNGMYVIQNVDLVQEILQLERDVELIKSTLDVVVERPSLQRDQIILFTEVCNTFKYGGIACIVIGTCYAVVSVLVELI
jgi:hypothetical protein